MVASEQKDTLRVLDFVGQKQADGFNAVFTSVHVVAQEKVVREWRVPSSIQKPSKIFILAMDITDNFDRSCELKEHRLDLENILSPLNQFDDVFLAYLSSQTDVAHFVGQECFDDFIYIEGLISSSEHRATFKGPFLGRL